MKKNKLKATVDNILNHSFYFNRLFIVFILSIIFLSLFIFYKPILFFENQSAWFSFIASKYFLIGALEHTYSYAQKALDINNDNNNAHFLKGKTLYITEQYNLAEKEYLYLLNGSKNDILNYYLEMSKLKYKQCLINDSIKFAEKGRQIFPNEPFFYLQLGINYMKLNNMEGAFNFLKKSDILFKASTLPKDFYGISSAHAALGLFYRINGSSKLSQEQIRISNSISKTDYDSINDNFNLCN